MVGWEEWNPEWRKASWELVEIIQVKHNCGLNDRCEGWVELDVTSIHGVGQSG